MGDATRGKVSPAAATRRAVPSLPGGPVTRRRLVRDDQLPLDGDGMKLARRRLGPVCVEEQHQLLCGLGC
jgi:hypothetical protein